MSERTDRISRTTLTHSVSATSEATPARDVFLVAFPRPAVLEMPPTNTPVGREWLTSLGVPDPKASKKHFGFSRPGGVPCLEDLGSTNGTFINGRRLNAGERVQLDSGAVVRIGTSLFVFRRDYTGSLIPSLPIGGLVAAFGLADFASELDSIVRRGARNILIIGETGTGKELAAKELASRLRPEKPFIPINVAALAINVFESQLYGHVRGSFSGADRDSHGVIGEADGGAVLLDEIGELALELQPKLLRLLENNEILRVGANRPRKVDVVIIGATNRSVDELLAGRFRRDLYARFAYAILQLPPLRDRVEDIFEIVSRRHGLSPQVVDSDAVERLMLHDWPENVRGLDAVVARALAKDPARRLRGKHVIAILGQPPKVAAVISRSEAERALAEAGGNKSEAARMLGIHLSRLRRLLES